ncbi:ExeA family protein [Desulfonatronum parangueonense]
MLQARRATESIRPEQARDRLLASLGLGFNPFSIAINQDSYYETAATRRIMELIVYGAETRKGFLLLSGEVGVGKSSLLLRLLDRLKSRGMVSAMVVNSLLDKRELLESICADFGLKHRPGLTTSHLLIVLHTFFLHQFKKGRNCVILVDEAHHLGFEALESLRMLANLETAGVKLVQVVICGQPELREELQAPRLRQFASRISIAADLPALTRAETHGYVEFKLAQAGSQIRPSAQALELLWRTSQGNPRTVNLLMERCLYAMVARGRDVIDERVMEAAIQDLEICRSGTSRQSSPEPRTRTRWSGLVDVRGLGMILTVMAALLLGWFIGHGGASSLLGERSERYLGGGPGMAAAKAKEESRAPAISDEGVVLTVDAPDRIEDARRMADMVRDVGLDVCVVRRDSEGQSGHVLELGRGLTQPQVQALANHYYKYFSETMYTEKPEPGYSVPEPVYCPE